MKNKKRQDEARQIFLIAFSFVIGGIVTLSLLKFTPILNSLITTSNTTSITKDETKIYEKNSLAASVKKIYDAVAVIQGYESGTLSSTGTGFVYKTDDKYGYLLTNHHVIADMNEIKIILSNDKEIEGTILGSDEYLDLAILRIPKNEVLQVSNIGSSENMNIGDTVFAVGTPMGYEYRGTVTAGILSGKDRMVSVSVSNSASTDWVMRVLQIDASINPGNSGGPLLNANGEVIGICSMKLVDSDIEGMGFAIPIEYAMSHANTLENGEKIKWPLLGISMTNVTETATLAMNNIKIDEEIKEGVVIVGITENTGAEKAGLKVGDIITKINGNKIKDSAYLRYELYQHQAGDTIEVTVIRNKTEKTVKVKLSKNEN